MIRSLIRQICGHRPDTPRSLSDLKTYTSKYQQPELGAFENILKVATSDFKRIYIILDGLDECPMAGNKRSDVISSLLRMHNWGLASLHVMVTSRPEPDIARGLQSATGESAMVEIDLETHQEQVDADIRMFIDQQLLTPVFPRWPTKTKDSIRTTLTKNAFGMYVQTIFDRTRYANTQV